MRTEAAGLFVPNVLNSQLSNLLFSARSRMLEVRINFRNKYGGKVSCEMGCVEDDSQQHLLTCNKLEENEIFNSGEEIIQEEVAALLGKKRKKRNRY